MKNLNKITAEKWMGFFLFIFILGTACTRFIFGESEKVERVKPLFDSEVQKFGVALGESFKKTFREVKSQNIKDKSEIEKLASKNSLEEFERAGLVSNEDVLVLERTAGASKAAIPKKQPLSKTQKKVMQDIQEAIQNSSSYLQFTDKLANINNKLFFTVPAKEQKGLQRAIAFMYYTMDALDDLAAEGLIKGGSEKAQFGIKTQKAGFSFLSLPALDANSWWYCMRETGGKKIARGMVTGFLVGLRGGIKGAAIGAVGGTLFGIFWAGVDCFK